MDDEDFVCPRCGNSDKASIGHFNGRPYCRLCLSFNGKSADKTFEPGKNPKLVLKYPLSGKQQSISDSVLQNVKEGKNVLIHAVTGAGKTELVYASIEYVLKRGGHVGFATPRKDVVIDLLPRFRESFENITVTAVYGEHTSLLNADIILLTTHQLYRYESYFDLLVLDEIDAFPYKGDRLLNTFFKKSVRGSYVLLSATPSEEDIESVKKDNGVVLTLFERYHGGKLPVPELIKTPKVLMLFRCMRILKKLLDEEKQVFLFTPTIEEGKKIGKIILPLFEGGAVVSSKEKDRSILIAKFKNKDLRYLITTSILERGVTVRNLQVIVYDASSPIYTSAALIQIAGRVGRKIDCRDGKVYFLAEEETDSVKDSIEEIKRYNNG